jgi:sn-glycerol 3-phosphate transport system permease protein
VAWKAFGYNFILFQAGISSVPKELVEASQVDGADGITFWWKMILPLISPTILFIIISTMSMAAEYVYTPIDILTGGGPNNASTNLIYEIYRQSFAYFRVGFASAIAISVFVLFFLLMLFQVYLTKKVFSYDDQAQ